MLMLKLDLGCGNAKREGFLGVDSRDFAGVDCVADLCQSWPWADESVDEAYCSHLVEHFTARDRIHFVNELYRVLRPVGMALVIVPNWASALAYGDLTHQWPPVSADWFYYLGKAWRTQHAPHNDFYTCDFKVQYRYSLHERFRGAAVNDQQFACTFYIDAAPEIMAEFTKL
jgi:SAM-dependent methyltransferase